MSLSDEQRRALRGVAHKLKPVVLLGKAGFTEPVLAEVNAALDHHELIKVKVRDDDRDARRATIAQLVDTTGAELLQIIGQIAVLYRPAPESVTRSRETRRDSPKPRSRSDDRPRNARSRDTDSRAPRRSSGGRSAPTIKRSRAPAGPRRPAPSRKR